LFDVVAVAEATCRPPAVLADLLNLTRAVKRITLP